MIVWPPNFFWKVFKHIQNFCHGDFFISFVKIQKIDFFEGSCFFQALPQIQLSSKIDWLGFHAKSDSSLRLIKNILFYLFYELTFFERTPLDVSDAFTMYLDVIWWIKKFKTIWSCKLDQNIWNFWRHFEHLMTFPKGWD